MRRLTYYLGSVPRVLFGIERPARTVALFLGLAPFPAEVAIRSRPGRLTLVVRDRLELWVAKETCLDEAYFPAPTGSERNWRVIDVGGGVGDFAVLAGLLYPDGVVHVYEPSPEAYALLEMNVRANGLRNVVTYQAPLASSPRTLSPEGSFQGVETRYVARHSAGSGILAASLDRALDALPGGVCDFLKIDCEGGEYDILLDSEPSLLDRVHRISLEHHDGVTSRDGDVIARHLESNGFRVERKANPVHAHLGHIYAERSSLTPPG